MFNIGGQEFALIILLALVVVGPEQLPGLVRKMGQYAAQARQMSSSLRAEFMAATEPMQDTFKEFQEGMNEFQTGMTDLSKTVTDAADVNQWGTGTVEDPIVPRGFAETESSSSESVASTPGNDTHGGRPDPWAADRVQPITEPTRPKKLEVTPPVNPWDPIYQSGPAAADSAAPVKHVADREANEPKTVEVHSAAPASQLQESQASPTAPAKPAIESQSAPNEADEEPA